ncbi:hypothetical protein CL654_02865 [bacterium]|nr:hypothetical protein [bacterium]|tara:strand:- start:22781 stop:24169 length:1389 start_codon:yes stop_codon:yes gene_type:complete
MDKKNQKTIFIVISQTILIRNILRSGGYNLLKQKGYKLVIFINSKKIPNYIKEEFNGSDTTLVSLYDLRVSRPHRVFIKFTHFLLWTKTTKRYFRYSKHFVDRSRFIAYLYLSFMRVVSLLGFLKPLSRWVEKTFFKEVNKEVERYFDEYNPDLVFGTSITSKMDNVFLKAGKRREIKTVAMPKSWDTVTKMYYRFIPDHFIVQNEELKKRLITLQDVKEKQITVVGFPQFDWYKKEDIIRTREEHFKKFGLDPQKPLIFFGSQGSWYDKDYKIADIIYDWVKNDELVKPTQILFRPHFSNVKNNPYMKYKGMKNAAYDDSYHISEEFRDNWDPSVEETIDFANTVAHANVVVIILSTLALDAACRDKPAINIVFGSKYRKGKDITPYMKYSNHYEWVLDTKATYVAHNKEELKKYLNNALTSPQEKAKEREMLRNKLCYKVDGKSSERMVETIDAIVRGTT